jgi:hydroxymethylpyrimidine pyrophosphatase-like HAD family hydrolase
MLALADWSFAMENAHPLVLEAARFVAPSHLHNGVVRTLTGLLAGSW